MKFLIVSHVLHSRDNNKIYGYGPYIKEMNLWLKYVDELCIVAPMREGHPDKIDLAYKHEKIIFNRVPAFNLIGFSSKVKTLFLLPYIFIKIFWAMVWADHIHLRCPGNMGLLGAVAQIFFPWKMKTVKYAGNWDPNSAQPLTYRIQKWIISNPFLSRSIKVLVYGKWPNQSSNILEFFTATYSKDEIENIQNRNLNGTIHLMFVGALSSGKRPMIAVKAVRKLKMDGIDVHLDIFGEGVEREPIQNYMQEHELTEIITLHGNQNSNIVKKAYQISHFLILMSKSEGWPKVVAEAMFWGCVPITTNVSCVNYMIGNGERGALVVPNDVEVVKAIKFYIEEKSNYKKASDNAQKWSQQYTLESFEQSIKELLDD